MSKKLLNILKGFCAKNSSPWALNGNNCARYKMILLLSTQSNIYKKGHSNEPRGAASSKQRTINLQHLLRFSTVLFPSASPLKIKQTVKNHCTT